MKEIEKLLTEINTLAKKQRTLGLTETEKKEQARLRRIYLDYIKGQVKSQLDSIRVVYPDDTTKREH